ncbi:MAG TPA: RtcB family protein [Capsulimonadaceae bacterium]|nr:RtcB family protein [Capsulimonadaceae bacterium]
MSWKYHCEKTDEGYYLLTKGVGVPVRIFMTEKLFAECEEAVFSQIAAATRFPGVTDVVITPDAHSGYVVPVGCVMATSGTLCQAPVGFDIGCGMMAFRSDVRMEKGLDDRLRKKFSEEVMARIGLGVGQGGKHSFDEKEFQEIIRTGANALGYEREATERDFIPVDDTWDPPKEAIRRGIGQLGSLGGGNHFAELQHDQNGKLWVMVHTGSRGFGHALATYFIQRGKEYLRERGVSVKGGAEAIYFEPGTPLYSGYKNAVAAGGNFAIANRLLLWEGVGTAFRRVFGQEPELVYEISHNLAQEEEIPGAGKAWIHRKGATRAFPAGHPELVGTRWEKTGHPILIPGSMGDTSYILYAAGGAAKSLYSVNHGCGRRLSRSACKQQFRQSGVNKQMKQLNVMVNAGANVPIDESPGAYKPARDVIDAVVSAGLATVAYELTPIASIKGND